MKKEENCRSKVIYRKLSERLRFYINSRKTDKTIKKLKTGVKDDLVSIKEYRSR